MQAGEVETPAMAAEVRRETRRGSEGDEEGDGGDGAQDTERKYKLERLRIRVLNNLVISRKRLYHSSPALMTPF